jgi:hypothetical protein
MITRLTHRQFFALFALLVILGVCVLLRCNAGMQAQAAVCPVAEKVGVPPPLVVAPPPVPAQLSGDPFQRTARAALAGKWGPLPEWKRRAYQAGVDKGVKVKGRVFLTAYWDSEGHDSTWDCRGEKCGARHLACNRLPYGTVAWVQWPVYNKQGRLVNLLSQIRTVLDTGAKSNDGAADNAGCDLWMDRHTEGPYGTEIGQYAVIGR